MTTRWRYLRASSTSTLTFVTASSRATVSTWRSWSVLRRTTMTDAPLSLLSVSNWLEVHSTESESASTTPSQDCGRSICLTRGMLMATALVRVPTIMMLPVVITAPKAKWPKYTCVYVLYIPSYIFLNEKIFKMHIVQFWAVSEFVNTANSLPEFLGDSSLIRSICLAFSY